MHYQHYTYSDLRQVQTHFNLLRRQGVNATPIGHRYNRNGKVVAVVFNRAKAPQNTTDDQIIRLMEREPKLTPKQAYHRLFNDLIFA